MRLSARIAVSIVALAAHRSFAIPQTGAAVAEQVSGPRAISTATAQLLGVYRFGPIAERITIIAKDSEQQAASEILLRVDAGNGASRPARVRLDLGRLVVFAEGDRLIALHTQNNEQYFEANLEGGLSPGALAGVLPPVPLPQIGFAMDRRPSEEIAIEPSIDVFGIGDAAWSGVDQASGSLSATLVDGSLALARAETGLLKQYVVTRGALTLTASVEPLVADDAKFPERWIPDVSNRTKVMKLTDLRPLRGEVAVGERIPTLALHQQDLSGWSLVDALKGLGNQPPEPNGTVAAALICIVPGEHVPTENIAVASRALKRLVTEFDNQRARGMTTSPRLLAACVGVLELEQIKPDFVKTARDNLAPAIPLNTQFLWTSAGVAELHRMSPGTRGAVLIVVDAQQHLLGQIPLDNTLVDEETIAREVRAIVSIALVDPAKTNDEGQGQDENSGTSEVDGSRPR